MKQFHIYIYSFINMQNNPEVLKELQKKKAKRKRNTDRFPLPFVEAVGAHVVLVNRNGRAKF